MTVSSSTNKATFNGNGSTTVLPYTFKVFSKNDVKVYQNNGTVEILLTEVTHYTISVNSDQESSPGGSVTMVTAPPVGYTTVLLREITATQETDLVNGGAFYAQSVESAFDKLTMLVQQLAEAITRSVKVGLSGAVSPDDLIAGINNASAAASASASAASASAGAASTSASSAASSAAAAAASAASLTPASQAEAEAGVENTKVMTPQRVAQAIAALAQAFPSGTRMSFQQTAAPTGWTKDTTAALDDSIMRIVTGTVGSGGSTAFSTFNGQTTVGATTLSAAQSGVPAHNHALNLSTQGITGSSNVTGVATPVTALNSANNTAASASSSHNHTITTSIKYYDFIIASKD